MKTKIILLSLIFIFALTCIAFAQEEITAQDLNIGEPRVLPGSFFYPLKNLKRSFHSFFTRDPVKKAELKLKFADEKLIETKLLAQKTNKPELIGKATKNYQQEIERIKTATDKIKEKADKNPKAENFLNKLIKHELLHQRILEKLENQVPERAIPKIKEARERHLEIFKEVKQRIRQPKKHRPAGASAINTVKDLLNYVKKGVSYLNLRLSNE